MARTYAAAFAGQGRAWRVDEFAALLASPHVLCVGARDAFALSRLIGDEAELLTIATHPAHQRTGLARRVLREVDARLQARGAARQFLEVAVDNAAAAGLYRGLGYRETARRADYYLRPDGRRVDALILTRTFAPGAEPRGDAVGA